MYYNPRVSIVIPVYNGSNYLREAIESALNQTYGNTEVIVVNDGSCDAGRTEDIARDYGEKIRYFVKENGGVASALNTGIRRMTGDFFSWLSHDDLYLPEKVERQVSHLRNGANKQILPYCDCELIDEGSNTISVYRVDEKYARNTYLAILSTSIGGCSLLIPKECFEHVGIFNEKLMMTQDNEMWLRIAKAGFAFEHIPEILLRSRIHPDQGSKILENHHVKERDAFYVWAIHFVGEEIEPVYGEIEKLLIRKRCFTAYREFLKIKHQKELFGRCRSELKYLFIKYFLLMNLKKLRSLSLKGLILKIKGMIFISSRYWEKRYAKGGDSGIGSRGKLARFKGEIVNSFVKKRNVESAIEFGCGDGKQLAYYKISQYVGLDASKSAIKSCKSMFKRDLSKKFYLYNSKTSDFNNILKKADLTLSIDVLYHLIEDTIFSNYINDLFHYSDRYVIIYSTNFDKGYDSPHQLDRRFTPFIEEHVNDFELIETIYNPYKGEETMSDFFIYKRKK